MSAPVEGPLAAHLMRQQQIIDALSIWRADLADAGFTISADAVSFALCDIEEVTQALVADTTVDDRRRVSAARRG